MKLCKIKRTYPFVPVSIQKISPSLQHQPSFIQKLRFMNKEMAGERVFIKGMLNQLAQAIE